MKITNSTESTSPSSGGLVVTGGAGVQGNFNVGGNTTIKGNLSVLGTTTTIDTQTTLVKDNLIVVNSAPAGLSDGGMLIKRYVDGVNSSSGTNYAGFSYKETSDEFTLAMTSSDPTTGSIVLDNYLPMRADYIALVNSSSASGVGTGGALTVAGGASISKNLFVGTDAVIGGSLTAGSFAVDKLTATVITVGNLFVTSSSTMHGGITAGTLNVTGETLLQGNVTSGAIAVTGESILRGAVTAGALAVTGSSIFRLGVTAGSLTVTGNSVLVGAVSTGSIHIWNSTEATGLSNEAALIVEGGALIDKSLFVGGPVLQIPFGTQAQRPSQPQTGYIRYNTDYSQFEGYGPGNAWGSLGGVVDIAQTTKILASETPSVTDGNLYFYIVNSERMRINSAGNVGIHTSSPNYTLDVVGTLRASIGMTAGSLNITG
jgi:cytoskeletal protein CcmA (bactofilin family)